MKKSFFGICILGLISNVWSLDYQINGMAESFGKFGFNGGSYRPSTDGSDGKYPTDSYASLFGALEIGLSQGGLSASLGGSLNGLIYDSTPSQGGEALGVGYVGNYAGFYGDKSLTSRNYIIHNAYLAYESAHFGIQAGRYEVNDLDWFSEFNQGASLYFKFWDVKIWGFFSNARAMVSSSWFWDFTQFSVSSKNIGAGGIELNHNGLVLSAYTYAAPDRYTAPGFKIGFDSNPSFEGKGFRSQTNLIGLFPINVKNPTARDGSAISKDILFGDEFSKDSSEYTQTLFVKQRFDIEKYHFGAMIYKNWGNANAWIGSYGDPFGGPDIWTASAYDKGASLSDMIGRNALSGMLFVGGVHGGFAWDILGRLTTSPRSDEQSIALTLTQRIIEGLSVSIKLEYFSDTTKTGYTIGNDTIPLAKNNVSDRSHVMTWITHQF